MQALEIEIRSWPEFCTFATNARGFIFRGQSSSSWSIKSSLERTYQKFSPVLNHFETGEKWALHEFKAKHQLYASNSPAIEDTFEWLSLLQHHGCPTRLVDFTHSLYVACHFAVSGATDDSAIWCLNQWAIRDSLRNKHQLPYTKGIDLKDTVQQVHRDFFNACLESKCGDSVEPHLIPLETTRHSLRLARQQGMFLASSTLGTMSKRVSFEDALYASLPASNALEKISLIEFMKTDIPGNNFSVVKLILKSSFLNEAITQLSNIGLTEETLFPDLDGLARSLVTKHIRV